MTPAPPAPAAHPASPAVSRLEQAFYLAAAPFFMGAGLAGLVWCIVGITSYQHRHGTIYSTLMILCIVVLGAYACISPAWAGMKRYTGYEPIPPGWVVRVIVAVIFGLLGLLLMAELIHSIY